MITLIDRFIGWWIVEIRGCPLVNVISHDLSPDSAIPPEWCGLVRDKVYDIVDEDGRYVSTVPRLKDVEQVVKSMAMGYLALQ